MCKEQYVSVLPCSYQRNGVSQVCTEGDPELKEFQADKTRALTSGSKSLSHPMLFHRAGKGQKVTEMGMFKLIIFPQLVRGDNSCPVNYRKTGTHSQSVESKTLTLCVEIHKHGMD